MHRTGDGFAEVSRYFCGNVVILCTVPNRDALCRVFGKRVDLIRLAIHLASHFFCFEHDLFGNLLFEDDLFGKPVPTFPDHALDCHYAPKSRLHKYD